MEKVMYVCPWEKDRLKSWSGTHMGLYNALGRQTTVVNVDAGTSQLRPDTLAYKMTIAARKMMGVGNDLGLLRQKRMTPYVKKMLSGAAQPLLQFDECPWEYPGRQYLFLDIHVDYLCKVKQKDPEYFELCGFPGVAMEILQKRAQQQQQFMLEQASGIFTMGHWVAKELTEGSGIPCDKVFPVGGGINVDPKAMEKGHRKGNKILFVGRDFCRKGGPLLLEAFQIARQHRPELELYIAGPSLSEKQAGENVHLLGDVSSKELPVYFNMCDVFCMPSLFEAYGLIFPEALTYGLPCIGANRCEMPYFIEDGKTGSLLKNDNPAELANMILDLLENKQIQENVAARRDWYLQTYSWDAVAKRVLSAMEG